MEGGSTTQQERNQTQTITTNSQTISKPTEIRFLHSADADSPECG